MLTLFAICLSSFAFAVTMEEAFQSALAKNESALQSEERVKQADERVSQATGAILPSVFLNGNHTIQQKPKDPAAQAFFPEKQTTINLSATQPLFRGFREFAGRNQRKSLYRAEEGRREGDLLRLYEEVAASYLTVLSLEQDLKNLKQQREIYIDRVKELQGRIRRGESRNTEALTAQSTEAALEAEIQVTEASLRTARENFTVLTALPADSALVYREKARDLKSLEAYLSRLEERPDVREARERLSAAESEVTVARGGHWPSVDVTGNYYLKRPDGLLRDVDWDVVFTASFPIFEGGLRFSQTREASSRLRESELELQRVRRQAEASIRSLHESLRLRNSQLGALKRSAELAEKNYESLQREFRRGLTRSIDLQLALTEYRASRRGYDQTRFLTHLDFIRLETAAAMLPPAFARLQ